MVKQFMNQVPGVHQFVGLLDGDFRSASDVADFCKFQKLSILFNILQMTARHLDLVAINRFWKLLTLCQIQEIDFISIEKIKCSHFESRTLGCFLVGRSLTGHVDSCSGYRNRRATSHQVEFHCLLSDTDGRDLKKKFKEKSIKLEFLPAPCWASTDWRKSGT